jgi:hypothetical protein
MPVIEKGLAGLRPHRKTKSVVPVIFGLCSNRLDFVLKSGIFGLGQHHLKKPSYRILAKSGFWLD